MKEFIKNKLNESLEEIMLETLLDEDYPTSWNVEEFQQLRNFAERKRYCDTHLQKISAGTGRIVYKIDNEKVLKLAKNEKGIAQNETETGLSINNSYYSNILARIFNYDQKDRWNEMELARKVTPTAFKQMVGVTIDQFRMYLRNYQSRNSGGRQIFGIAKEIEEIMNESEFVNDVIGFMNDTELGAGDLGKLNSWGLVHREGSDSLVMIDYGLTGDVYDSYYK